jgi:hypothetical protein
MFHYTDVLIYVTLCTCTGHLFENLILHSSVSLLIYLPCITFYLYVVNTIIIVDRTNLKGIKPVMDRLGLMGA